MLLTEILVNISKISSSTRERGSEGELKNLLMRVKQENERANLRLNIKKLKSWHPTPLLHGK